MQNQAIDGVLTPQVGFKLVGPHPVPSSPWIRPSPSDHEEYVSKCVRCNFGGCDVKVSGCECSYHVRCIPIDTSEQIEACPHCNRPTSGLIMNPMTFTEIDEAHKAASIYKRSSKRGRKRKNTIVSENESIDDNGPSTTYTTSPDAAPPAIAIGNETKDIGKANCRTGRWTREEIQFCDNLIASFKKGQLPLAEGVKLNDFLTSMLKSKQSRLTKKMKNAKLSSVTFRPVKHYIKNDGECCEFSRLEDGFFLAIQDAGERAELKFHMSREWRDMFCDFCMKTGQKLDADAWLTSVDEMDRRSSIARDASHMKRRRVMMVNALSHDSTNVQAGVFIERNDAEMAAIRASSPTGQDLLERDELLSLLSDDIPSESDVPACISNDTSIEMNGKSSVLQSSPFLHKLSAYIKRRNIPFEQADLWVPSLTPGQTDNPKCRLSFAGSTTIDSVIPASGVGPAETMSAEMKFNLLSFGDYSQKFSFDVGCGLPGRVYSDGASTWEQNVQIAPSTHFERCGGANQWGIKTIAGIPVASPNVGRIIIVLYSVHNRKKCENMVSKLINVCTKLLPTPKWKLVVDISVPNPKEDIPDVSNTQIITSTQAASKLTPTQTHDTVIDSIIRLLGDEMPSNLSSATSSHVQSLISLRLLLLRPKRTTQEDEIVNTILGSYSSYSKSGRCNSDIAIMLARDFMFLTQQQPHVPVQPQWLPQPHHSNSGIRHTRTLIPERSHLPHASMINLSNLPHGDGFVKQQSMNEVLLDPKLSFYAGLDDARLDNSFRPDSPALTPIVALEDNFSIVSN